MGLGVTDRLDGKALALHLGAEVRSASDLISISKLDELESAQPGCFSACTFQIGKRRIIVTNPLAAPGRRQSDLAHEASHLILGHAVKQIQRVGELSFFTCDPDEEQEANWQAGCLLLPRTLLVLAIRRGMDADTIARVHQVSSQMANYRIRATGVRRQSGPKSE
jgi:Zn-dependent peptidase ImmA (M78 family)